MLPWVAGRKASRKLKAIAIVTLLVCIAGAWHKLTAKPPAIEQLLDTPNSFPANSFGGVQQMLQPSTNLSETRQNGRINVFTYYSDSCPGSQKLAAYIGRLAKMRPDVAFQMVDLGPQWRQNHWNEVNGSKPTGTPHVMIYSPDGSLLAGDTGGGKNGLKLLCDWMNREIAARGPRTST